MSEILRVGLVSEGPTDQIIIQKIVELEFPDRRIQFTAISPTDNELFSNKKEEGFGWGGVYRVCKKLEDKLEIIKATGLMPDIIVIQLDGDVMMLTYESARIVPDPTDIELPCYSVDCTIKENCQELNAVLDSWIYNRSIDYVCCIPYINTEAWAAYILYASYRAYIKEELTKEELESFLLQRTKDEGRLIRKKGGSIKKNTTVYRDAADALSPMLLVDMKEHFSRLNAFCGDIVSSVNTP